MTFYITNNFHYVIIKQIISFVNILETTHTLSLIYKFYCIIY